MNQDHFKSINDTYGHRTGDQLLSASVNFVIKNLRPYDNMFRYGGEEFVISMPSSDIQAGLAMIERLRVGIERTTFLYQELKPIQMTDSFGLAMLEPNISVEKIIERANIALYAAKNGGRNCVRIWNDSTPLR